MTEDNRKSVKVRGNDYFECGNTLKTEGHEGEKDDEKFLISKVFSVSNAICYNRQDASWRDHPGPSLEHCQV
jgi:hypothetical protein